MQWRNSIQQDSLLESDVTIHLPKGLDNNLISCAKVKPCAHDNIGTLSKDIENNLKFRADMCFFIKLYIKLQVIWWPHLNHNCVVIWFITGTVIVLVSIDVSISIIVSENNQCLHQLYCILMINVNWNKWQFI